MLDRFADWFLDVLNSIPILLGADPHNAQLVRALASLFLIVFFIYIVAMRPFAGIIGRLFRRSKSEKK